MTKSKGMNTPFWRGFRTATIYYCVAIIIFVLLRVIIPLRHDAYIYFLFLPVVLMVGIIWAIVCLIASFFRVRPRGTLVVHAMVIILAFLLFPPRPPVFPKSTPNEVRGELMPTFPDSEYVRNILCEIYRNNIILVNTVSSLKLLF